MTSTAQRKVSAALAAAFALIASAPAAAKPHETVLYTFSGGSDGGGPSSALLPGAGGWLYGTTHFGGITTCGGQVGGGCGVVFGLFPFMFITGFAMSPSITSVFPIFVTMFGGHQSARTLHFFSANLLVLFVMVHVTMVTLAGFGRRCRAMITGYSAAGKKRS